MFNCTAMQFAVRESITISILLLPNAGNISLKNSTRYLPKSTCGCQRVQAVRLHRSRPRSREVKMKRLDEKWSRPQQLKRALSWGGGSGGQHD